MRISANQTRTNTVTLALLSYTHSEDKGEREIGLQIPRPQRIMADDTKKS